MKDAHPYGKLVIKKTDSTSKTALPGAEFELREKESGKVVEKLVTDKTGTATSGKIPIATYKNGDVKFTVKDKSRENRGIYPGRNQSTKWL